MGFPKDMVVSSYRTNHPDEGKRIGWDAFCSHCDWSAMSLHTEAEAQEAADSHDCPEVD